MVLFYDALKGTKFEETYLEFQATKSNILITYWLHLTN